MMCWDKSESLYAHPMEYNRPLPTDCEGLVSDYPHVTPINIMYNDVKRGAVVFLAIGNDGGYDFHRWPHRDKFSTVGDKTVRWDGPYDKKIYMIGTFCI